MLCLFIDFMCFLCSSDEARKEYETFIYYYQKLASTLPVTDLCPRLVSKKVITTSEVEEIDSLSTNVQRAKYVLQRISASLEVGQTKTFYLFLTAIEELGLVQSSQVVSDIKQEIKSGTGNEKYIIPYMLSFFV